MCCRERFCMTNFHGTSGAGSRLESIEDSFRPLFWSKSNCKSYTLVNVVSFVMLQIQNRTVRRANVTVFDRYRSTQAFVYVYLSPLRHILDTRSSQMIVHKIMPISSFFNCEFCTVHFSVTSDRNSSKLHRKVHCHKMCIKVTCLVQ